MRVLFLTQVLPYPLDAGPKVRNYYVLRHLAQQHEVTLVSFIRSDKEEQYRSHLESFCHAVHLVPIRRSRARDVLHLARSLGSRVPFLIARDHVPAMEEKVRELIDANDFDVVHADQLAMAQYAARARGRTVLDDHNAMWMLVRRLYQQERSLPKKLVLALEWNKTKRYEGQILRRFDHTFCVSREDRAALLETVAPDNLALEYAGQGNPAETAAGFRRLNSQVPVPRFDVPGRDYRSAVTASPICIDAQDIEPVTPNPATQNTICIGGMFYPPNVDGVLWYAREILPLLKREVPETHFYAVGGRPDAAILAQAAKDPAMVVTGYVQDTTPFLKDSSVFVVPLRSGGGMRVKVLEAWARALPVVCTRIGCEGIDIIPGENILIADTPEEFARATAELLCNPALARRIGEAGRKWVESRYNWRVRYQEFSHVYEGLMRGI